MLRPSLLAFCAFITSANASEIPEQFRTTAVPDAAENYVLRKYATQDADPKVQSLKVMTAYLLVRNLCETVVPDATQERELARTTATALGRGTHEQTRFEVVQLFRGFDKRDLIHLCAGGMTLFGPKGILAPHVIRSMSPRSKLPYVVGDPNPIINVVVP